MLSAPLLDAGSFRPPSIVAVPGQVLYSNLNAAMLREVEPPPHVIERHG